MRLSLSSLVVLATALAVVADPLDDKLPINPPLSAVRSELAAKPQAASPTPEPQTNAKRMAAGLPPLSPRLRHRHRPSHGGVEVHPAHRPRSSPRPPINIKCNILVKNATNGFVFGYITPTWNIFGEYGIVQPNQAGSLEVSFSYTPDEPDTPSQLEFLATNGPSATYPFVGATVGFTTTSDNLGPGNPNYAYITGTTHIPVGPASEGDNNSFSSTTGIPKAAESAIWEYNPNTKDITAQWVNTDGSAPGTHLVYVNDSNQAFVLTGDVAAFQNTFGPFFSLITFTCVTPIVG